MPLKKIIPAHRWRQHLATFSRHIDVDEGEPFRRTIDVQALGKDGTEIPVEASLAIGGQGAEQVFTAVIRDVSHHHNSHKP